jgi:hypothetical protein
MTVEADRKSFLFYSYTHEEAYNYIMIQLFAASLVLPLYSTAHDDHFSRSH